MSAPRREDKHPVSEPHHDGLPEGALQTPAAHTSARSQEPTPREEFSAWLTEALARLEERFADFIRPTPTPPGRYRGRGV